MRGEKLQVRRALANDGDARLLAELGWRTFDATFAPVTPRVDLDLFLKANYTTAKLLNELRDERNSFFVAETVGDVGEDEGDEGSGASGMGEGDAIGYLKVSRQLDYVPRCVVGDFDVEEGGLLELARLYIEVRFKGLGLGSELMEVLLGEATRLRTRRIWLGVWEHNEGAKGFYERWGFRYVGSHPYPVGNDPQTDLLMVRDL